MKAAEDQTPLVRDITGVRTLTVMPSHGSLQTTLNYMVMTPAKLSPILLPSLLSTRAPDHHQWSLPQAVPLSFLPTG